MTNTPQKTDVDPSTARRSARDQWARAALDLFQRACRHWRDDPGRSLELVRGVLEGFAHAVCVALYDGFPPHRGTELNRQPLGEVLPIARQHLPADLRIFFVDAAKKLGDWHHHNQGEVSESSPLTAQATLLHCAALLQWLYKEVLGAAPPQELATAIDDLHDRGPAPAPAGAQTVRVASSGVLWAVTAGFGLLLVGAAGGALWIFSWSADPAGRPQAGSAPFENLGQPERSWIEAYQSALDARDADRLVSLHAIPTRRFFMGQNYDAPRLRKSFQGWFDHAGPTRRTGFEHCSLAHVGADGTRALRCDAYIDPPMPSGGPSRAANCLVFTSDGKVLSRTEIGQMSCPPP